MMANYRVRHLKVLNCLERNNIHMYVHSFVTAEKGDDGQLCRTDT